MPHDEQQLRQNIVRVGRLMFEKGWIAASDGNISARLQDGRILATPAGVCKGMLDCGDPILCDPGGKKLEGEREPSTEMDMHLAVYRTRPDVHAVVHAHPPTATGFAAAHRPLNLGLLPEVVLRLGAIPLVPYETPGTPALGHNMLPYIARYDAVLLANHGAVAWGTDVLQAFSYMETVELFARITLVAELAGGAKPLPRAEIDKLFTLRPRYGIESRRRPEGACPVAAEDVPSRPEKIEITREELLALIDDALRARETG